MKCPRCGEGSKVIDTKQIADKPQRRRECTNGHRFITTEQIISIKDDKKPLLYRVFCK